MRSLAARLGTGAMTLYNYAANREELELLVVEAVLAEAKWHVAAGAGWRQQVQAAAHSGWMALRAHPNVTPLVLTRRSRSPAVMNIAEALWGALSQSGLTGGALLVGLRTVSAFVMGFSQAVPPSNGRRRPLFTACMDSKSASGPPRNCEPRAGAPASCKAVSKACSSTACPPCASAPSWA